MTDQAEHAKWDEQDAIELHGGTKVRIDGKVYAFEGFTLTKFVNEWTVAELEFAGQDEPVFENIQPDEPDETVTVTTTEEFKDGKRVRYTTSTMTARAVRPERGIDGKVYD